MYIAFVVIFHTDALEGDEARYLMFASNLVHGFYSPPAPNINLWNGPVYPIVLLPLAALRLPLIFMTLLNALFYYLSIVFLFKALSLVVSSKKALAFSLFWGCYINAFQKLARITSETLTMFLISLLLFTLLKAFSEKTKKYVLWAGFLIGTIVLTKIIFGYVLLLMLLGAILLWLPYRKSVDLRKGILILLMALAVTAPYLAYTYHLTGRILYWGNSGGASLYWMSTPYPGEYGDYWHGPAPQWHRKNLAVISDLDNIKKDDALKKLAFNNIKGHSVKYVKNWIANLGRLFFNFPYSKGSDAYRSVGSPKRSLAMLPFNLAVFCVMVFAIFKNIANWRRLDQGLRFLFIFIFLYLGASSLVSAYSRQFYVIVPAVLVLGASKIKKVVSSQ
jgi:4-amino-4-deoxy-L-arabinose transferase-like glycosyltransferase